MNKFRVYAKRIVLLLLIVLGILVAVVDVESIPMNHSLASIRDKKVDLDYANQGIFSQERGVEEGRDKIIGLREEVADLEALANKAKTEVIAEELKLHFPSILIKLENEAVKNDLQLEIEHKNITTLGEDTITHEESVPSEGYPDDYEDYEDYPEDNEGYPEDNQEESDVFDDYIEGAGGVEAEVEEVDQEINSEKDLEVVEEKGKTEESLDIISKLNTGNTPVITGLDTTLIPVRVHGSYQSVRAFIKYIDELNYLNPISVTLKSDGKTIDGYIIISAIHKTK